MRDAFVNAGWMIVYIVVAFGMFLKYAHIFGMDL